MRFVVTSLRARTRPDTIPRSTKLQWVESPAAFRIALGNLAAQCRPRLREQLVPIAPESGAPPPHASGRESAADRESRDSFGTGHSSQTGTSPPRFPFPWDRKAKRRIRPCRLHLPQRWRATADKRPPSVLIKLEFPDRTVHRIPWGRVSSS